MKWTGKLIGAAIGTIVAGPIGLVAGAFLGNLADSDESASKTKYKRNTTNNKQITKTDSISALVSGETSEEKQTISKLTVRDEVALRILKSSGKRGNMIYVCTTDGQRVGFLPEEISAKIASDLDKGVKFKAKVTLKSDVKHWIFIDITRLTEVVSNINEYITRISGVTFEGRQEIIEHLTPQDSIYLQREPTNQYDPNAIRVYTLKNQHIGWVSKEIAGKIATEMDKGIKYEAKILMRTGGNGLHHGLTIMIRPISSVPNNTKSKSNTSVKTKAIYASGAVVGSYVASSQYNDYDPRDYDYSDYEVTDRFERLGSYDAEEPWNETDSYYYDGGDEYPDSYYPGDDEY